MMDWSPLILSLSLAASTTIILFILSLPIASWLSQKSTIGRSVVDAIVTMPMVLPPTVIGYYLLVAFNPENNLGKWYEKIFHTQLSFSFTGILIGSIIYSLPFMVRPLKVGLQNIPQNLVEASYTLGKSYWDTLWKIRIPNCKNAILTGIIFTFAHTIGEFGVVLMIGGNIPNKTQTASIALYNSVEIFDYKTANTYALIMIIFSFVTIISLNIFSNYKRINTSF